MKIEANIPQTSVSPPLTPKAAQAIAVTKARVESPAPAQAQTQLTDAVQAQLPESLTAHVALSVDHETGLVIGTVIDRQSGKVLRQIPSEEMVQLIRATREALRPLVDVKS